jgi:hypothetical protein
MVDTLAVPIRRESLAGRFTDAAVLFLKTVLGHLMSLQLTPAALDTELLRPFQRVVLIDSTSWDVQPKLRALFPGSGGNASAANCKLHLGYDYKNGRLMLCELTPGTTPDNRYTKHIPGHIQAGDLVIFDLGYAALATYKKIWQKRAYFLSRFNLNTNIYAQDSHQKIELASFLAGQSGNLVEVKVGIGAQQATRVPCRLIAFRMQAQIAEKRRRKLTQEARKKGYQNKSQHYELAGWTIMITNVDATLLPTEAVWLLYIIRWYVEILFKQLKSVLHIHHDTTSQGPRLQSEIYGTLIVALFITISHTSLNAFLWNKGRRELSLDKFAKRIQQRSFLIMNLYVVSRKAIVSYLVHEYGVVLRNCVKGLQKKRRTSLEQLDLFVQKGISTMINAA